MPLRTDLSGAEAALRSIAEAYRRKDIEATIACKDFHAEARLMLRRLGGLYDDEKTIQKAAEVLELSFRKHTLDDWPNFDDVISRVVDLEEIESGIYMAREAGTCRGRPYSQRIYLSHGENGWRVLNPVPAEAGSPGTVRRPWWKFW